MAKALPVSEPGSTQSPKDRVAVSWRVLGSGDLERIYDLHRRAAAAVGRPELIRPETPRFFKAILGGRGSITGVEDTDGLLAYGVLQWDLPPEEDLRELLDLPPDAPFAKLAGASVRPGSWGSGLHEALIAHRVADAAWCGLTELYATSAPGNVRSWTNLLNQGFGVRAVIEQYGGHLRYIVHRNTSAPAGSAAEAQADVIWCKAGATERERALLADNRVGVRWRTVAGGGREIGWVPRQ